MAEITVRKLRFPFGDAIDLDRPDAELSIVLGHLALSLTMPYLEPYLIRTMKVVQREITDPELLADVRAFSQQEGHHYRNHAAFNEDLRAHFGEPVASRIREIEAALDADYQRFSREKSLRFNTAYAEGFEAMTCGFALAGLEHGGFARMPGGELWDWHLAEEIEHRTVAFDVYHRTGGSYWHRIVFGTWAQFHYVSYIVRFANCMARALGRRLVLSRHPVLLSSLRRYLHTWSPRYDPARVEIPRGLDALLLEFSGRAASPQP